ncbi:hypothetical protein TEA_011066 [Camellia sinensis var. sinensis]|uniref:Uncharacterized protein n=1 Tax=Camellia sinensis var. sinensis TaxID=542762 RepID=A0A4V3WQG0_CAMSN|nr:hypothetical protein TEA_011066 [Camellia sinensis var. sinensis]
MCVQLLVRLKGRHRWVKVDSGDNSEKKSVVAGCYCWKPNGMRAYLPFDRDDGRAMGRARCSSAGCQPVAWSSRLAHVEHGAEVTWLTAVSTEDESSLEVGPRNGPRRYFVFRLWAEVGTKTVRCVAGIGTYLLFNRDDGRAMGRARCSSARCQPVAWSSQLAHVEHGAEVTWLTVVSAEAKGSAISLRQAASQGFSTYTRLLAHICVFRRREGKSAKEFKGVFGVQRTNGGRGRRNGGRRTTNHNGGRTGSLRQRIEFADDDDDNDITSSTSTNAGPQTDSRTEEINDLRRKLGEHDRRLQRMEKMFKAMTYVIVFWATATAAAGQWRWHDGGDGMQTPKPISGYALLTLSSASSILSPVDSIGALNPLIFLYSLSLRALNHFQILSSATGVDSHNRSTHQLQVWSRRSVDSQIFSSTTGVDSQIFSSATVSRLIGVFFQILILGWVVGALNSVHVVGFRNQTGQFMRQRKLILRFGHSSAFGNVYYKMACSSSNNSNIRLKRRLCDCGITAARHTVKSNQNGNKGRVSEEHCNYFKFADDNDDDEIFNATPRTSIRSEEFNDRSTRVYEMDNEFEEHGNLMDVVMDLMDLMLYVIGFGS